jgi:hypothetical protein
VLEAQQRALDEGLVRIREDSVVLVVRVEKEGDEKMRTSHHLAALHERDGRVRDNNALLLKRLEQLEALINKSRAKVCRAFIACSFYFLLFLD